MRVITEISLRDELKGKVPEVYYVPAQKILSPAAKEYLSQKKIKVVYKDKEEVPRIEEQNKAVQKEMSRKTYEDYETGAVYNEKPEAMTQIADNKLVTKNHPRIVFRGKMDSLQALIIVTQAEIYSKDSLSPILNDLDEVLSVSRSILRAEVLEEQLPDVRVLGLTANEIRDRSHYPENFFQIKQMTLPHYKMGLIYTRLNQIRTMIREAELLAIWAIDMKRDSWGPSIVLTLNRLSSVMHIMMCMVLANHYNK
ncbi:hypothetical protein [Cellulosilyticum sp. I15G10I2]|uniref:hypothetical protein n=1 Tax=Cellulosilyticum sp. I15G10I2 TaxID=1892843 RepID=UPI00085BCED4|nr:hypothetical protein [Cellulosilyticum sp. I15G10I2]